MTTIGTSLAGRIEAVDKVNDLTFGLGNVLKNFQERAKGQVTDLASPQPFHAPEVQRESFADALG
jgi:hypothetical protein